MILTPTDLKKKHDEYLERKRERYQKIEGFAVEMAQVATKNFTYLPNQ